MMSPRRRYERYARYDTENRPYEYRTNADGSAVCAHRDLSCCPACVASDPLLVEVAGVHYHVHNVEERAALLAALEEI